MKADWPKPWDDITPDDDGTAVVNLYKWVDLGALRVADDTVYINADGGRETDGDPPDAWLPLGVYLAREGIDPDDLG